MDIRLVKYRNFFGLVWFGLNIGKIYNVLVIIYFIKNSKIVNENKVLFFY